MTKPVLHGPGYSTYVRAVRIALTEKGVDYDLREFDFIVVGFPEGFEKLNPFMKVPAFEHDGFTLHETSAILRYVDEAFDGPALQPGEVKARARMAQIIAIADNYLYQAAVHGVFIQRALVPSMGGETANGFYLGFASEFLPKNLDLGFTLCQTTAKGVRRLPPDNQDRIAFVFYIVTQVVQDAPRFSHSRS